MIKCILFQISFQLYFSSKSLEIHPLFLHIDDPDDDVKLGGDVIKLPENNDIIVLADGIAIDARHNEIQNRRTETTKYGATR